MRALADVMTEMLSASDVLAAAIVKRMSPGDDEITTRKAYAKYGKGWIDEATEKGLLHPRRKGHAKNSKVMYSVHEIITLIESEKQVVNNLRQFIANG